jgi:hypothetical protein
LVVGVVVLVVFVDVVAVDVVLVVVVVVPVVVVVVAVVCARQFSAKTNRPHNTASAAHRAGIENRFVQEPNIAVSP